MAEGTGPHVGKVAIKGQIGHLAHKMSDLSQPGKLLVGDTIDAHL